MSRLGLISSIVALLFLGAGPGFFAERQPPARSPEIDRPDSGRSPTSPKPVALLRIGDGIESTWNGLACFEPDETSQTDIIKALASV